MLAGCTCRGFPEVSATDLGRGTTQELDFGWCDRSPGCLHQALRASVLRISESNNQEDVSGAREILKVQGQSHKLCAVLHGRELGLFRCSSD